MSITVGDAVLFLKANRTQLDTDLQNADTSTRSWADKLGSGVASALGTVVQVGLAGAAAAIVGLGTAAMGSLAQVQNWANTIDGVGDVLGTNADESAGLAVAIQGVGGDVSSLTSQMAYMARGLLGADGEIGKVGETLQGLGVNFMDANGNILPTTEILTQVADKLAAMPDGLEKTSLMMELFGKSGKDMSDVMNAMSGGGLEAAEEKAKALGLALGEEGTQGAIQFGYQMNELKMMSQGLFVTLGSELLPILAPLLEQFMKWAYEVLPSVRDGISSVVSWITESFVPGVESFLATLEPIFTFFVENWQPILAGLVAGIIVAIVPAFIAWAGAAWTAAVGTITALAPIILPIMAIAAAVGLLVAAWQNDWGGIRTFLTQVWEEKLKPIFDTLKTWLDTNIPIAIAALKGYWENVLLPAIQAVWSWLSTTLFPFFEALGNLFSVIFKKQMEVLTAVWENVLLPAIKTVWTFLNDHIFPIFEAIGSYLSDTFAPIIETVAGWIGDQLTTAFNNVSAVIETVTGWINDLAGGIENLSLPDWLTPGSPTPFELGLRGISDAMGKLADQELPGLQAKLQLQGVGAMLASGRSEVQRYDHFGLTINTSAPMEPIVADFEMMKARAGRRA